MKQKLIFLSFFAIVLLASCAGNKKTEDLEKAVSVSNKVPSVPEFATNANGKVVYVNSENFAKHIFNFRTETNWNYKSETPCIIDFYADWCKPCKMIAPILEELAIEYKGQVQFYKVDTDKEVELSRAFGIQSLPTIMACPLGETPVMAQGAMPKSELKRMISEVIFKNKK